MVHSILQELRQDKFTRTSIANRGIEKKRKFSSSTHLECSSCRQVLPKESFSVDKKSCYGVQGKCKDCKKEEFKKWRTGWNGAILSMLHHAHEAHKKRSKTRDIGDIELTKEILVDLLETQNFKCYYSGKVLTETNVSLERLDPNATYMPGNVALIRRHFQSSRQWTVEKFNSVPRLQNVDTYDATMVSDAFEWQTWSERDMANKAVYSKRPGEAEWTYHENNKAAAVYRNAFSGNVSKVCQPHEKLQSTAGCLFRYAAPKLPRPFDAPPTLVPFCQRLLADAKSHTKSRNAIRSRTGRPNLCDPTITTRDIMELYRRQRGRCAYLNIPMLLEHGDENSWTCSLERIDRDVGYTYENSLLVVEEVNDAAQWSKEDVHFYWNI